MSRGEGITILTWSFSPIHGSKILRRKTTQLTCNLNQKFAFLGFQLLGVETFGEAEFWLALLKLVGLVAYFLFSLVYVPALSVGFVPSPLATLFLPL